MKSCGYCGRENPDEATVCYECGTQFTVAEETSWNAESNLVLVFISRLNLAKTGFLWAGLHLFISTILAVFCFYIAFGEGLSDAYHPDPPILKIAEVILFVLQAPVVFVHWLLAKINPSQVVWKPATAIALAMLWSVLLGCMLHLIGRKIRKLTNGR